MIFLGFIESRCRGYMVIVEGGDMGLVEVLRFFVFFGKGGFFFYAFLFNFRVCK